MDCERIASKLSAYQDSLLNPQVAEQVRRHLESCDACRRELQELERLSSMMQTELAAIQPPEGFGRRVMARLPDVPMAKRRSPLRQALAWSAAAALVLAVCVLAVFHGWFGSSSPTGQPGDAPIVSMRQPEADSPGTPQEELAVREPMHDRSDVSGTPEPPVSGGERRVRLTPRPPMVEEPPVPETTVRHDEEPPVAPEGPAADAEEHVPLPQPMPSSIELARVPIGDERPWIADESVEEETEPSPSRTPSIKLVARPSDGGLSIGLTLE